MGNIRLGWCVCVLLGGSLGGCSSGGADPTPGVDAGMLGPADGAVGVDGASPEQDAAPGEDAGAVDAGSEGDDAAVGSGTPGSTCGCDDECAGTAANPGLCVSGVCMVEASAACSEGGSRTECPAGSRCWGLEGTELSICWPDCDAVTCSGRCDADGSCIPAEGATCDDSCSRVCEGTEPPPEGPEGTPPAGCVIGSSDIPDWRCEGTAAHCGELVQFNPSRARGYWDYPLNGETEGNQYRSWVRRDVMMLVQYATAMVACQAGGWTFGNGGLLGLGDMSEANGAIPGTSIGSPGHPAGTHVNGHDMDIAYYQVSTSDNRLRAVCEHVASGEDVYHCVSTPTLLDPWRTALFLGHLHASPNLRVIGVDGQVGPVVDAALRELCTGGWVSGAACTSPRTTYETTDMGRGWFRFHHHHLHVSVSAPR